MKYKKSFLSEVERFDRCVRSSGSCERTEIGIKQFHEYESHGTVPDGPDAYFKLLLDGKKWWEWTVNEYANLRGTPDWPGWMQLAIDFKDDPSGFRQVAHRCGCGHISQADLLEAM